MNVADRTETSGSMPHDGSRSPDSPRSTITRRAFIAGSAAVVAGTGVLGLHGAERARTSRLPRLDTDTGTGTLTELEMLTVLALAEVLVPVRLLPSRSECERLVARAAAREPGILREYRSAAALLDRQASRSGSASFAELPLVDRDRILDGMLWRYHITDDSSLSDHVARVSRRLERVFQSEEERRLRNLVVPDLLRRLYRAAAPQLIGYGNLPGVPGDPREYTLPPRGA